MCVLISYSTSWFDTVNSNLKVCCKNEGKAIKNFDTTIYIWKLKKSTHSIATSAYTFI